MAGLTHVFANTTHAPATPAAYSIAYFDRITSLSQPLAHELPWVIMDIIGAEPTSSIAVKLSKLYQDRATAALPAGGGHLASSLGRY